MATDQSGAIPGLEDTLDRGSGSSTAPLPEPSAVTVIGSYRLLQLIGEGGMGEVWLAEQVEPVRRRVAVKVIKPGMDTKQVVARFESERQALALMDHPAIAKVFDGGSTPEGRPYFVMEYVKGVPITEHCDTHKLSTVERLELLTQVCEGVQHAHQKAIIHRDLKPSNILVSLVDGKAQPKIIDFGIAKATGQRLTEKTLFTEVGAVIGTPEYMSPEQAELTGQDVDTRTDVYSLGVILYQLLTGELPFRSQDLRSSSYEELRRKLKDVEPPRPSIKLSTLGDGAAEAAKNRSTDRGTLGRQLEGDLDAITMKALEKERVRRYGTPSELAADIERHLRNEPVLARPPSTAYRVQKYVKRHRVGVGLALGLVTLLLVFAAIMAVQARRIADQRDRANREAAAAKHVADFLTHMFNISDPSAARGNSITAREILDRASKDAETALAKDPVLQAQMLDTMGTVYSNLGLYPQAHSLLQGAVETRQQVLGSEHPDTLKSMSALAALTFRQGKFAEAEKLDRATLDIRRRVLGPEHPDTLQSMSQLAVVVWLGGHFAEGEKLLRETLDIRRRVLGPEHPETLKSMHSLAGVLTDEGLLPAAEKLDRETLALRRRVLGPDHPDTLTTMSNLALVLSNEGNEAEAEQLERETLQIKRRVLGPEHPDTLYSMNSLATTLEHEGRLKEAEDLQLETLTILRRVLGADHPRTLASMSNLASLQESEGRSAEAETLHRRTLALRRRALGPEHPDTLLSMNNVSISLIHLGRFSEAEALLREVLEIQRRVLGPSHPETASTIYNLACLEAKGGDRDLALELIRDALDHGLSDQNARNMAKDLDLKSLWGDPRFAAMVAGAQRPLGK